jgi:hypothetical protein
MEDKWLLPGLPADLILAAYLNAPGNEIESGKFANPESSAALVANTFGYFLDKPKMLPSLPGIEDCGWPASSINLEAIVRFPWTGGRHPCLDVLIETSTCLIGVESKRFEPFRSKTHSPMAEAYWRPVWGDNMRGFESCRDDLRDGNGRFERLDSAQLIKHAFGLRTAVHTGVRCQGKRPILFYLYAEPECWPDGGRVVPWADRIRHRAEVEEFSKIVAGDEVLFRFCSYATLLEKWAMLATHGTRAHAAAVTRRFFSFP